MSSVEKEHIVMTPGTCGGRPRIEGTRIRVQDIYVWHELLGKTATEIVADYSHLTLADVYAALAYYWDHREEIQRQMKDDEALLEAMRRDNPSRLWQKLGRDNGDGDSPVSG
jgi:uncharacterized protein (DUF433 family)